MHTDGHHPNGHDSHAGYETRDVALHTLVVWVIGLFIFIGVTAALTIPLYFFLVPKTEQRTARTGQNELRPTQRPLPDPVIQPAPIRDMAEFERNQLKALTSYGRIEDEPGKVHIPIDQAIDQVLAQGLPATARPAAPPPPAGIYTAGDTTGAWPARPGMESATGGDARRMDETPPGTPPDRAYPGPMTPPGGPPGPVTIPQGMPESQMRGTQNELTPTPRRDEPR